MPKNDLPQVTPQKNFSPLETHRPCIPSPGTKAGQDFPASLGGARQTLQCPTWVGPQQKNPVNNIQVTPRPGRRLDACKVDCEILPISRFQKVQ